MREKNLIILCLVFVVLVSLVFVKKNMTVKVPTVEEAADIIQTSVSAENINSIALRIGDGNSDDSEKPKKVQMAQQGEGWVIPTQFGVRGNEKKISSLLSTIEKIKGELRSNKEELLGDYGIDDSQGTHVELQQKEGPGIHFVIGTETAGAQNNFVRLGGTNAVYLVNENLMSIFGVHKADEDYKLDIHRWVDKHILSLEASDVSGIILTEANSGQVKKVIDIKRELIDEKKQWQSANPYAFGLSASKIKGVINTFNNTYASEIIAPDVQGVFDSPEWVGLFTLESGDQVKLVRGKKDDPGKNYYMKVEGAPYYFLVPVSTFNSRIDQQGSIFVNNPLKVEQGKIEAIEISSVGANKKFNAVKKTAPDSPVENQEEDSESPEDQKKDYWETAGGEKVEEPKITEIINKIKEISLVVAVQPDVSIEDDMTLQITQDGAVTKYAITKDIILPTGKECRFLRVGDDPQSYCASKPQVIALQNALP